MATDFDIKHMNAAISLAQGCAPISARIPKVGAIVAVNDSVIGEGRRGTGESGDDEHAEKNALADVKNVTELPMASVYTTLEPCTPVVRSNPSDCCTKRLCDARVKKVFIGMLDPNQGVTGKGLWELWSQGIDVELFPPDLARKIRSLNSEFIREQQSLGIKITKAVKPKKTDEPQIELLFTLEGTYINAPELDVVFALTSVGSKWWPQPHSIVFKGDKTWSCRVYIGSKDPHTVSIVKANELGSALIEYFRKITSQNVYRKNALTRYAEENKLNKDDLLRHMDEVYPGIEMARLPKGLELLAQIDLQSELLLEEL